MRTPSRHRHHRNESTDDSGRARIQPRPFSDPYDNQRSLQTHDLSHVDLFSHTPQRGAIQAKLAIGQPHDLHEQEADRVASQVMNMSNSATQASDTHSPGQGHTTHVNLPNHAVAPQAIQRNYAPSAQQRVNVGKVFQMQKCWYDAAVNLLYKKVSNPINSSIQQLITNYQSKSVYCQTRSQNSTPIIEASELEATFPKNLPGELAEKICETVGGTVDVIKEELRNEFIRVLNNRNWKPIVKHLTFGSAQQPEHYTSTITPVNENYHETYGAGLGKNYGQTGLNSMSTQNRLTDLNQTESNRTTNLAYTEYRTGHSDPNGEVLFAAFRSGSLSGKSIKDPPGAKKGDANWAATLANTEELLQAMVIKHLQEATPQRRQKLLAGTRTAQIPVLSTSLQSSGRFGGETRQINDQIRALKSFDFKTTGKMSAIDVVWSANGQQSKHTVWVEFDIIAMNLGVNAQGGWIGGQQNNDEAIAALGKAVDRYLDMSNVTLDRLQQQNSQPPLGQHTAEMGQIAAKNRQIIQLWEKVQADKGRKRFFQLKKQNYKLAARIANLAFLIGYMVHFNCKSGKDRTGLQDAEAKFLAMEMHRAKQQGKQQIVPEHTLSDRNQQRRDDHQKMLFESGSLEMQEYNTGGQGYKIAPGAPVVRDDKALMERVGGQQVLTELQGLKRYTDIDKI